MSSPGSRAPGSTPLGGCIVDTRQTSKHRAALFAAVAIVALALVPAAFADKGGNGGGKNGTPTMSGFNLYVLDSSTSLWIENAQPTHGGTVKFEVPATVSQPNVELDCSQNGAVVYSALSGWYETGAWTRTLSLSSQV